MESTNQPQEGEKQSMEEDSRELKEKPGDQSSPARRLKFGQKEGLSLISDLESGFSSSNIELDATIAEKGVPGERLKSRTLQRNFSNLEKLTKEMDEELAKPVDGVEGAENGLVTDVPKLKRLGAKVNDLKLNVNYVNNAQKGNSEQEEKALQTKNTDGFSHQKNELSNVQSEMSAQIEALTKEVSRLQQEADLKRKLEEQIDSQASEINQVGEEKKTLQARILELEITLTEKKDEIDVLQERHQLAENESSARVSDLSAQISYLQQELTDEKQKSQDRISRLEDQNTELISKLSDQEEILKQQEDILKQQEDTVTKLRDEIVVLQKRHQLAENKSFSRVSNLSKQISHLQQQLSDKEQKFRDKITQLEDQNAELTRKLSDQQEIVKEQEDTITKLREESKLVKGRFLQAADRKIEEVAEEFKKNFEDKLRILSQRIRVAEQLHVENKDNWKRTKDWCEQEHPELEKKLKDIMETSKAELWKMSNFIDEMMKGMESVIGNFEKKERGFLQRISGVAEDIQVSKNWVKLVMEELKPLKYEHPASPFAPMDEKEKEKMMEEKVHTLEAKVKKERADKLRLVRGMYELQNKVSELEKAIIEKDEGMVRLSEEKVEAIKQLCLWIDHHQSRFDHLKEVVMVKRKGRH